MKKILSLIAITTISFGMTACTVVTLPQTDESVSSEMAQETVSVSEETAEELPALYMANAGDIFSFGTYEQDNDTSNGAEPIEWQVLATEDDKVLLISKYCLDCKCYDTYSGGSTWETCYLREWLNGDFIDEAFSDAEREKILISDVSNPDNSYYGTSGGNDTQDQVFLLDISEAATYFKTDSERTCTSTTFVTEKSPQNGYWWLRSPGEDNISAALVDESGEIIYAGSWVFYESGDVYATVTQKYYGDDYDTIGVRPAMWVDREAPAELVSVADTSDDDAAAESETVVEEVLDVESGEFTEETIYSEEVMAWSEYAAKYPERVDPTESFTDEYKEYSQKMGIVIFELRDQNGNIVERYAWFNPTGFGEDPYDWANTYSSVAYQGYEEFEDDVFYIRDGDMIIVGPAAGDRLIYTCQVN